MGASVVSLAPNFGAGPTKLEQDIAIGPSSTPMLGAETVRRIVKVNHAGEYGAIRSYASQIAVARRFYPEIVAPLSEMRGHEIGHEEKFRSAMPQRGAKPCRALFLWSGGGAALGFATALCGRQGAWLCTAAVEAAVHRHLDEQISYLGTRDAGLAALIGGIREEERAHLAEAEARLAPLNKFWRALRGLIGWTIDALNLPFDLRRLAPHVAIVEEFR